MPTPRPRRSYKELRLQQLRSFCATARLGSLGAAAASLGVSQPTVWEQVHALERELDVQLIEPQHRGCRLTAAGRLLVEMALPIVAGADSLKQMLQEQLGQIERQVIIAAPQRVLVEDLSRVVLEFRRNHPEVRLKLLERVTGQVTAAVEAGEADLGITSSREPGSESPQLLCEPAYELDALLLTPQDHPLSRQGQVRPRDLRHYPLVNAIEGISRPEVAEQLRKLGSFDHAERFVEAVSSAVIRHYVHLGFGIGLVLGQPSAVPAPPLHERVMSRYWGRARINLVGRKGVRPSAAVRTFADTVKEVMNRR